MATPAHRLIQDQNLNILYNGTIPGQKTDVAITDKKPRFAGRKALNDISNSRKPSVVQPVRKDNPISVISIEKDPADFKAKFSKAGGRKALTDVTNSVKPSAKHGLNIGRKLNAVADKNVVCMADERFMHNHQECIKAQTEAVDMGYFLKLVGLNNDIPMQPSARRAFPLSSKKPESNTNKHSEMQEMLLEDRECRCCSPVCRSPQSPKAPYMSWADNEFPELTVIETPKLI
ncbi:hypothetical protein OROGR_016057 [Orobanche gracilis]